MKKNVKEKFEKLIEILQKDINEWEEMLVRCLEEDECDIQRALFIIENIQRLENSYDTVLHTMYDIEAKEDAKE